MVEMVETRARPQLPTIENSHVRAIQNLRLECDWCGRVPPVLYLPTAHSGAFCQDCVTDVIKPPAKLAKRTLDGEETDGVLEINRKLTVFLKRFELAPTFCGRGRGRPRKVATDQPDKIQRWKFFCRTDRVRITRADAKFRGDRGVVWGLLSDGASVDDVLALGQGAGLSEQQVVAVLRKMTLTYHALRFEKPVA